MIAIAHSQQLSLDGYRPPPRFDGWSFRESYDRARLTTLIRRVLYQMLDGQQHPLAELARLCGGSETGVSAKIRDLRKRDFGGFTVVASRVPGLEKQGAWRYRLVNPTREQVSILLGEGKNLA